MELKKLKKLNGVKSKNKRLGRGYGSGKGGHTVGKGTKGQKSRQGNSIPYGFEGGQVTLFKKLPKMGGFTNPTRKQIRGVNLIAFNVFNDGDVVTPQMLVEKGILRSVPKHGVKVLGVGALTKKIELKGFIFSQTAKDKIEK